MSSPMQVFLPNFRGISEDPMVAHESMQNPTSPENFDLTADDDRVISDSASAWSLLQQ